ncbi:MAG: hypothetical protein QXS76_04370 [Candidatus Bathyarchaeia archaeon]
MTRKTIGYYKDRKGRTRPITARAAGRHSLPAGSRHDDIGGKWIEKNGERVFVSSSPDYATVNESDIPEENRLDNIDLFLKRERDPEKYRQEAISYLENRIRGLRDEWFQVRSDEERNEIVKLINYYQRKIEEYEHYSLKPGDGYKEYSLGGGDKVRVYSPVNPVQELTGGKVQFRKKTETSRGHLYKYGAKNREKRKFEREYGKKKGDYIYGAVVGKVRRERLARGGQ